MRETQSTPQIDYRLASISYIAASVNVPDLDCVVPRARDQVIVMRREGECAHWSLVRLQNIQKTACLEIPWE